MQWFNGARVTGIETLVDIGCSATRIDAIEPHQPSRPGHALSGALVMGALAHWHTHLDKTFTIARVRQTEPGLLGAIKASEQDVQTWTVDDIYERANKAMEQSWLAGCSLVRSHVNWMSSAEPLAWSVLADLAAQWKGRIDLQIVALVRGDLFDDHEVGQQIAVSIKHRNGMLGAFIHSTNATATRVAALVNHARMHDLGMDIHLDEEINPSAGGLAFLLSTLGNYNPSGHPPIAVSHVCALSVKPSAERNLLIDGLAKTNIEVISLPSTNLYLQDQSNPALPLTPTIRGIAPVHELKRAGVSVRLGCDNVQDPFYPWGSYDPIDLMHIGAPALQLVNCFDEWAHSTAANKVAVGEVSNLTIFPGQSAASWPSLSGKSSALSRKIVRYGELL
jgi:cytosine/creatinine deaminase